GRDNADVLALCRGMRPDYARQRIAVGNGKRGIAVSKRLRNQLLRVGAASQKRKIAGDLQLRIAHWTCHFIKRKTREETISDCRHSPPGETASSARRRHLPRSNNRGARLPPATIPALCAPGRRLCSRDAQLLCR